ncbi:MAG: preprotein translocase subunit YajC [Candidatus Nanopelagicales bacterium]|nr:preprotein translocase subunit YajC [Candidatus Nanopelagicales bacterium]
MDPTPLLMIALLGVAFWLLVIRPAKKKQADQRDLVNRIKVGDRVMTTAGLFGYVAELRADDVGVEIADGVVVFMVKPAIAKVMTEPIVSETETAAASEGQTDESIVLPDDEATGPSSAPGANAGK